jgi:hypothetical protein
MVSDQLRAGSFILWKSAFSSHWMTDLDAVEKRKIYTSA